MATVRFNCPFAGLSGCHNGGGNGLTRGYLITHLRDKHCNGEAQAITKHSLATDLVTVVFVQAAELLLNEWLLDISLTMWMVCCKAQHDGFTLSLLDSLLSKGLRTVKSIPPKCRLGFSRVLKGALDKLVKETLAESAHPMLDLDEEDLNLCERNLKQFLDRIKSFPRGTSCGRDGLRAQHLLDCLSGAAVAISDELVSSITQVVNLFLEGKCPMPWRLVSKVSATMIGHSLDGYLDGLQFGVRVPGGGEAIIHGCNRWPARLYYGEHSLWSCQGVQQGDPLGPLLFSLVLHPLICKIKDSFNLCLQAWYLDDGTIVGDTLVVGEGWSEYSKTIGLLNAVAKINDPQCELLLIRACAGVSKLYFAMRTCPPRVFESAQLSFDMALRFALERIITASGPGFGDWQWRIATLPLTFGGLGIYSAGDVLNYAFIASRLQSATLHGLSYSRCWYRLLLVPLSDDALMALWQSQREDHTSDWLRVVPISGLGQTMNGKTYRSVLCYRLGVPLFSVSTPCSTCSRVFVGDIYGGSRCIMCWIIRRLSIFHNIGTWTTCRHLFSIGEVDIGLDEGHDKKLRPADMLLYSWDGGLDVCVDLTGSSPLTQTGYKEAGIDDIVRGLTRSGWFGSVYEGRLPGQQTWVELLLPVVSDAKDHGTIINIRKLGEQWKWFVHNLINLRFTSVTEDAYASAIFLLLKQSCQSQPTIDTRINLHILQHQSKSPVLSQGVYESVHENQLTHTRRVLNECTETDETEPVSFYRSLRARWRAIIDGLSDVVVTNAGTIRQFAMKTCVSLLPVVGDTKGNYCKIGQAHGCTTTVINVMKKKDKMLSNYNCQHLDGMSPFHKKPDLIRSSITENGETALHVATSAKRTKQVAEFILNLVAMMEMADLELQNKSGNTALCLAAIAGNLETIDIMVNKNKTLLRIPGSEGMMPLYMASSFGHYDVVKYLFEKSNGLRDDDGWDAKNRAWLLHKCVEGDMFDIALQILTLTEHIELANDEELLRILARKPDAFVKKSSNFLWKTVIWEQQPHPPELIADYAKIEPPISLDIVFIAAEMGNTKFIVELIRQYPGLIFMHNKNGQSIFHIAVEHRHEGIYNLLYDRSPPDVLTLLDKDGNNMVHLVGKIEKAKRLQDVPGVLQMHVDVLWLELGEEYVPLTIIRLRAFEELLAYLEVALPFQSYQLNAPCCCHLYLVMLKRRSDQDIDG
ncbi:putative reverse transcriptase domain-containing protein [Tanacetum coccineum]